MPALELDSNAEVVLARYERQRAALNAEGFFLGRTAARGVHARRTAGAARTTTATSTTGPTRTAASTARSGRSTSCGAAQLHLLDRASVQRFEETAGGVRVDAAHADTGATETYEARALVLAAGTFGTARLVLRSLERYDTPVPIVCNPYTYVPTLNLGMLGRRARPAPQPGAADRHAACAEAPHRRLVQAQVFSYRSLLTFKLMKELPLPARQARRMLQVLMPAFAILGIHHEDRPDAGQDVHAPPRPTGGPDVLEIRYRPTRRGGARAARRRARCSCAASAGSAAFR